MSTAGHREGGCHCGAVRFRFAMPEQPLIRRCNCTICAMKGIVMLDVPKSDVAVTKGQQALSTYQFGSEIAKHHFCSRCGIHVLQDLRSEPDNCGVSLACVDGMSIYDLADTPVFDGQNHPADTGEYSYVGVMRFERTPRES
ncbi:GFA family protein [Paraurantiacibacter namhicola]|uniref:Glutathione-dependent formaldehyde-activating enzyme n=1 Tax=Paraurantiacibacter namhicola TaxID=645517 RepID=A0A1C7DAA9_9SPHN|nr:GFA family protein [Paraurantiacibacter namhicola]ANU08251.1 Glutathione-dependent formaldehyde-activating enzyme [Paraurantiacibacter namhicola]